MCPSPNHMRRHNVVLRLGTISSSLPLNANEMKPIVVVILSALVLGSIISGEPSSGFTRTKNSGALKNFQQPFKTFDADMVTKSVAVALLAGLGILSGGAAISALSSRNQLQNLQGNFRTVCNAVRAAGAVDGETAPPIGPPGPPGPAGPPGMDGTCSATGGDCSGAQADIDAVIASLRAVSASNCNF